MKSGDEISKIKIICRMQGDSCEEQLLMDGKETVNTDTLHAQKLLQMFTPEHLIRQLVQAYGKDSVLVFRTDVRQVQEFCSLLEAHGVSL